MVNNQFNISSGNLGPNKADAVPTNGSNNNNNNNNNKTKNNNSNNTNSHNTNNSNSNNNPNNNFAFEYSNWEDTPDLNFLSDASHLQMDSPNTNLSNSYMPNLMSPMNLNNNAPSPADYALQLQHYQNLLLETQNMLNLKQLQKNNDSESNQNSSNLIDSNRLHNLSQNSPISSNQNFQMNFPNSPNLSTFLSNATNPQLLLSQQPQLQQQLALQLAQAQLGNQNKIMRNQFQMDNRSQNLSAAPGSISTPASSSSIPALNQGNAQTIQLNDNAINTSTTPTTTITPSSTINSSTKLANNININDTNHNNNNSKIKKSEPPQPRTKIRPCDHCRRRKTKCVMIPELHSCRMCQTKGLKCTFNETNSSFKRGLSGNEPDSKRMKFDDPTIEPPPNIALRDVHPIKDYATMQGHSLLKKTLSLQYPRSSFYVGPTSIYDPIFLNKVTLDKIDQFQLNKTNSIRNVSKSVQFMLRDDFSEVLYERAERDSDTVERYVAPHGQALIDLYFRTVHPSFPVLHKKIFLEKYSRTHREFGAPLLAAVYLLAIQWWDYEPNLSQFPKPNVDSLHKFATKAFADIIQRPKLSAVQAGLLLLQCRTPNSSDKNWLLCSEVVAVAEELGLGLDCSNWRLPKWERGLRRRLAWAVYIQDKWSALVESRPSHIYEGKNWLVKHVSDEDFPEKGNEAADVVKEGCADIDNGKESFKQLISLSEILSEILDTFFTKIAMEKIVTIDQVLSHAKPLQLKLRQWYHLLSKELQMSSLKPRQFNSNGTLQLAYFATEITLHRRIISALCSQSYPPPPAEILKVCRNAAKTRLTASIEFTRDLKAEHMQAFWHSAAVNNFALIGIFAALLFVTSEDPDEANGFKEQLFDYRWVLKVNSRSFGIANEALEKIDGILKNIPGLLAEYIPNTPGSNTPQPQPQHTPNTNAVGTPNSVNSGNKKTTTPGNRKKISTGVANSNNANANSTSVANLQMLSSISNSSNKDKSSAASTPALSSSAGIFRGSPRSQINSPVTQIKSPMSLRSPQHNKKVKEEDKREEKNDKKEDDKKEEKIDDKKIDNKITSNRVTSGNKGNNNNNNNNNINSEGSKDKNDGDDDIYLSQFNNLNIPQFNMNMMSQMNSLMGINVMNMNELGNGGDDTNSGDPDNKKVE